MNDLDNRAARAEAEGIARQWIEREAQFERSEYRGTGAAGQIVHIRRAPDILLCAPHAVNHFRYGNEKLADRRTGGLSLVLGERLGVGTLAPCGSVADWESWEERTDEFRVALDRAVAEGALVVDLH